MSTRHSVPGVIWGSGNQGSEPTCLQSGPRSGLFKIVTPSKSSHWRRLSKLQRLSPPTPTCPQAFPRSPHSHTASQAEAVAAAVPVEARFASPAMMPLLLPASPSPAWPSPAISCGRDAGGTATPTCEAEGGPGQQTEWEGSGACGRKGHDARAPDGMDPEIPRLTKSVLICCLPILLLPIYIQAMEAHWSPHGERGGCLASVLLVMAPPPHLPSRRRAMETYSPLVLNNPELQLKLALLLTKASHTACWCVPAGVCLLVCAARTREAVHVGGRGAVDYWGPFRTLPNLEAGCLFQVARCHSNC